MSFIATLGKIAKKTYTYFTENETGKSIANVAILGYINRKTSQSIAKQSDPQPGTRITQGTGAGTENRVGTGPEINYYTVQFDPDTNSRIPVVYGDAFIGGKVIDARLSADKCKTMWFCLALSEQTGIQLSDSSASEITVKECYYNNQKLVFGSDGITVVRGVTPEGENNELLNGQISVYPFSGDSETPTFIGTKTVGNSANAYDLFPEWDTTKQMNDLVFVLIKMDYYPVGDIRGLGNWTFRVENTMDKPGDCLYDYMTNDRYGGSVPVEEIDA